MIAVKADCEGLWANGWTVAWPRRKCSDSETVLSALGSPARR
jgi:hypothetical protein